METGPKSAEVDEIDDIYKEKDPIEASLNIRKKAGAVAQVVPNKDAKSGKFFFNLKLKGDIPALAKPKVDPTKLGSEAAESKQEGAKPQK